MVRLCGVSLVFALFAATLGCDDDDDAPLNPDSGDTLDSMVVVDGGDTFTDAGVVADTGPVRDAFQLPDPEPWPDDPYVAVAADPNRMHRDIEGLRDNALKNALEVVTKRDHDNVSYDRARYIIFTDLDITDDNRVECIYTGRIIEVNGRDLPDNADFNVEHSWPRSDGATGTREADLHHIFPCDSRANSTRGNLNYGETYCSNPGFNCGWSFGGSEIGGAVNPDDFADGVSTRIFEVRLKFRGDMARAHFYFSTRYGMPIDLWEEEILRKWNWQDPVDAWEADRNDMIEGHQGNRNPYVDRPDLVQWITDF